MAGLFEFFFNLLLLIWENIDSLLQPILSFLSTFAEYAIKAITDALEWLLSALDWIIELFNSIANFFGQGSFNGPFGGGGGRPR